VIVTITIFCCCYNLLVINKMENEDTAINAV